MQVCLYAIKAAYGSVTRGQSNAERGTTLGN